MVQNYNTGFGFYKCASERWERKGAYGLPVVCRGPTMSRWIWAPAVAAEASCAKQRELRGETLGRREARGESERERVKGYEREYNEFILREIWKPSIKWCRSVCVCVFVFLIIIPIQRRFSKKKLKKDTG